MGRKSKKRRSGAQQTQQADRSLVRQSSSQTSIAAPVVQNLHVYCPETKTLNFHAPVDTFHQGNVIHNYNGDAEIQPTPLPRGAEGEASAIIDQEMEVASTIEPVNDPKTLQKEILERIGELVKSSTDVSKWEENQKKATELFHFFGLYGATLKTARSGSVLFVVLVRTEADRDTFITACTDGTLARGLTQILVTQELERQVGVELCVRVEIKGAQGAEHVPGTEQDETVTSALQAMSLSDTGGSSSANRKTILDMSPEDVKDWLIHEAQIPNSVAVKFLQEGIHGALLDKYEGKHLQEDFELSKGLMRQILYARDDLKKKGFLERSQNVEGLQQSQTYTPGEEKIQSELSKLSRETSDSDGEADEAVDTTKVKSNIQDQVHSEKHTFRATELSAPSGKHAAKAASVSKEQESAKEAKLRYLLTGNEDGSLDCAFHPILVVNKPSFTNNEGEKSQELKENFDFVSLVNWNAVFDCDPRSLQNGLCSMVDDKRKVKKLLPERFRKQMSAEDMEFNDIPAWIFVNGWEDQTEVQSPTLGSDWNEKYAADVDKAVDFYCASNVIPKDRAVIVFLLLSRDNIPIMSDIFKKLQSSMKGQGQFTFLFADHGLYEEWAKEVKRWLPRENLHKRSFIGTNWSQINYYIQKQFGKLPVGPAELPMLGGKSCELPDYIRSGWLNIEVLPKNECENTAVDEESPEFKTEVEAQELAFYQGNAVTWWNFHLTSYRGNRNKGFNQVLRRGVAKEINKKVKALLDSAKSKDASTSLPSIATVTIFHEPGSGGSTSARQVLWDFHKDVRCVIVQRAIMPTIQEILDVRQYGYTDKDMFIPPIMVLLDDLDDGEVVDLISALQNETKDNDQLTCIILHCKRTFDPDQLAENNGRNSVVIKHKLTGKEPDWFEKKFLKYGEEYEKSPEKLIGFMVMRSECNPDYITRIVTNSLKEVTGKEAQLLKYIAVITMFMEDFGMPVSCCDEFMNALKTSAAGHKSRKSALWENNLSNTMNLLLVQTLIHTHQGPTRALKLVNPLVAKEIVKQFVEEHDEKIGNIVHEFINESTILDTNAYIKKYIINKIRDLLVKRKKIEGGSKKQSEFSPLIEYLYSEDKGMPFQLLKEARDKFKNGVIEQLLARLYKSEKNLVEAEHYAKIAISLQSNNSFFWDTRGRIIIEKMHRFGTKDSDVPLNTIESSELLDLLQQGIDVFKKCQELSRSEDRQVSNYAGYCGELKVVFLFLHILEHRVKPFCLSGGTEKMRDYFLTDEELPELEPMWRESRGRLKRLTERIEVSLGQLRDHLTFSKGGTRGEHSLEDEVRVRTYQYSMFYEELIRYFAVQEGHVPPQSVHQNPETMSEWRRAQVKAMKADSFQSIFSYAKNGDLQTLKKVYDLLRQNHPPKVFDLKLLVCVDFALSSFPDENIDYNTVVKRVQRLNEFDRSLYGAYFTLLLSWPTDTPDPNHTNVGVTAKKAVVNLRDKWNAVIGKTSAEHGSQSGYDRSLPHHQLTVRKPNTHHLLTKEHGIHSFVHISMFHAIPSTLEEERHKFWTRSDVTEKLITLEGTIQDKEMLVYKTKESEVYIRMARRWQSEPSQEKVSFFLGFSFAGPIAYNVKEKNRRTGPIRVKEISGPYPGYLRSNLHNLQKREEEIMAKLDQIAYMSRKRRNRQQLTPEEKRLQHSQEVLEKEVSEIRAKIQQEVENDDEDDSFILVTKGRRGKTKFAQAFLF